MIKKFVCASVGVAAWAVFAAGSAPKAELVGSVEFASFSDYQKKIVDLGTTINNPIVSMMAVPVIQSNLTENFGNFRPDSPMKILCYADVAAVRKALTSDSDDFGDDFPQFPLHVDHSDAKRLSLIQRKRTILRRFLKFRDHPATTVDSH